MQPNQLEFESQKQPAPIEFKNNNNNLNKNAQGGGTSGKKKAPNQKMGFLEGHIQAMMAAKKLKKANLVPGSAPAKKKEDKLERPSTEFNLDTRPSKYFDANIDPKSKRE